ncbi:MAG: hypothetical protein K8T26_05260 [Lentisphaerae bacterium]|nr:hypothetical protein [Lentisphaerota bacterium]
MKPTPLAKRIKELEKQLDQVDGNIRSLSKTMERTRTGGAIKLAPLVDPSVDDRPLADPVIVPAPKPVARRPRDERFVDYLSTSIGGPTVPLRHERSIQRNKAILTIALVLLLLFWLLHRLFL